MDLATMIQASPYHRWLGVKLVRAGNGEVEVHLPFRDEFLNDDEGQSLHGGIIATLADIAGCFAVIDAVQHDVPTVDLRMDYLKAARRGDNLIAVARTIKAGRNIGVADIEVRTEDGRLVAVGRGTFFTGG